MKKHSFLSVFDDDDLDEPYLDDEEREPISSMADLVDYVAEGEHITEGDLLWWRHHDWPTAFGVEDCVGLFEPFGFITDCIHRPPCELPTEPFTVYRGAVPEHARHLSWSLSRDVAVDFAERAAYRGRVGGVYRATVSPEHVLAFFCELDQHEVVVDPAGLRQVRRLGTVAPPISSSRAPGQQFLVSQTPTGAASTEEDTVARKQNKATNAEQIAEAEAQAAQADEPVVEPKAKPATKAKPAVAPVKQAPVTEGKLTGEALIQRKKLAGAGRSEPPGTVYGSRWTDGERAELQKTYDEHDGNRAETIGAFMKAHPIRSSASVQYQIDRHVSKK